MNSFLISALSFCLLAVAFNGVANARGVLSDEKGAQIEKEARANYEKVLKELKEVFATYGTYDKVLEHLRQRFQSSNSHQKAVDKRTLEYMESDGVIELPATSVDPAVKNQYMKVVNELHNKFANLKENCYPLPTGCRCVEGAGSQIIKDETQCRRQA